MVVEIVCEMCGEKFDHVIKHNGRARRYCDECIKVRNRERVRRYFERLANPGVDVETDHVEITADPIPENKAYRDRITKIADERESRVREYVDRLLTRHEMRVMDAADSSAQKSVRRVLSDGSTVEWRGSATIGGMSA